MSLPDYASYADEIVQQLDSGEIDAHEVDMRPFVEDDEVVLTPELADRLPDEKIDEYNEQVAQRDRQELREEQQERTDEAQRARERLMGLGVETETVDLAEMDPQVDEPVEVTVKTELSGRVERNLNQVEQVDDFEEKLDLFLGIFEEIVVSPEGYADREAWRDVWEARGTAFLVRCLDKLLEPMLEGESAVKSFRQDE